MQLTRALTQLGRLPVYVAATTEYAGLARFDSLDGVRTADRSLTRLDATPSLQVPFRKWPFLAVRSSIAWHQTWWSESLVDGVQTTEPVSRQYADLRTTMTGPVLAKVWDTPGLGFADRLKHVIEPEVTVQRTTDFDRDRIVLIETGDYVYGGTTTVTYGVTNRIFARRRAAAGAPKAAGTRELLTVQLQQSRYSDPRASTVDANYCGGFTTSDGVRVSPIALSVRANPTDTTGITLRAEYDANEGSLDTVQLQGNTRAGAWLSSSGGWSRSRCTVSLLDPTAQCCGIAFEYQTFNYGASALVAVKQDRRFNISFTLAGLGSFSNVLGAFGIGQGATGTTGVR